MAQGSDAGKGDVLVLVGTRKGAFILSSDGARRTWAVSGPHSAGADVFHLSYDGRGRGTLFAAVNHMVWGPQIQYSHDLGQSWVSPKEPPRLAGDNPPHIGKYMAHRTRTGGGT